MVEPRTDTTAGARARGAYQEQGGDMGVGDQAQSAMRGAAETASEMWDEATERGERYLRQGSQALGNLDGTTLTGWLVAGAVGFGLAWLIFGQQFRWTDDMARRMSQSSERYRPRGNRSSRPH